MNAFQFGKNLRMKLAAGPAAPVPTASLTGKSTLPAAPITTGTRPLQNKPQQPTSKPTSKPPVPPAQRSWGGYVTDTNSGLMKDVGDYFTHFIPQNVPGTTAYDTRDERYKNLPVDHNLSMAGTAALGTGLAAGTAAAGLAAAPVVAGAMGSGGTAAGVGGGVAAATQTPAGQNMLQRGGQMAGQVGTTINNLSASGYLRATDAASNVFQRLPQQMQQGLNAYGNYADRYAQHPMARVATEFGKNTGDPMAHLPTRVTLPVDQFQRVDSARHKMYDVFGSERH